MIGTITLNLHNVPWDQALAIILRTRNLAQRQIDNVILVAPAKTLADQEEAAFNSQKKIQSLVPLSSELLHINYANSKEIAGLIQSQKNSLLSARGKVSQDERTNTIWLHDTPEKLEEIRQLVRQLDVPVRQVLIEARIVYVAKNSGSDIGVQFGVTKPQTPLSGTFAAANHIAQNTKGVNAISPIAAATTVDNSGNDRLNVNMPTLNALAGRVGLALAKLGPRVFIRLRIVSFRIRR